MTKNQKIAAAVGSTLVVVVGLIAFEAGKSQTERASSSTATTLPVAVTPTPTLSPSIPVVAPAPSVKATTTYVPTAAGMVPVSVPAKANTTYVQTPSGALPRATVLQAEQPILAPGESNVVQRTVVEPVPATQVYQRTTAYVPATNSVHRVYVHRRVHRQSSGKIHVSRAIKHTVAFAVKMPGRLRL